MPTVVATAIKEANINSPSETFSVALRARNSGVIRRRPQAIPAKASTRLTTFNPIRDSFPVERTASAALIIPGVGSLPIATPASLKAVFSASISSFIASISLPAASSTDRPPANRVTSAIIKLTELSSATSAISIWVIALLWITKPSANNHTKLTARTGTRTPRAVIQP